MTLLLDTHFLIWILTRSKRLASFPWLDGYRPWGLSPVSFLEMKFLAEVGKLSLKNDLFRTLRDDGRFVVDEVPIVRLVEHALPLEWTRDPFDRLLAAHSAARGVPLCTVDEQLLGHHRLLAAELRG
jgi:PIN domain nuclease of toxin-antitoxin system